MKPTNCWNKLIVAPTAKLRRDSSLLAAEGSIVDFESTALSGVGVELPCCMCCDIYMFLKPYPRLCLSLVCVPALYALTCSRLCTVSTTEMYLPFFAVKPTFSQSMFALLCTHRHLPFFCGYQVKRHKLNPASWTRALFWKRENIFCPAWSEWLPWWHEYHRFQDCSCPAAAGSGCSWVIAQREVQLAAHQYPKRGTSVRAQTLASLFLSYCPACDKSSLFRQRRECGLIVNNKQININFLKKQTVVGKHVEEHSSYNWYWYFLIINFNVHKPKTLLWVSTFPPLLKVMLLLELVFLYTQTTSFFLNFILLLPVPL